MKKEKYSIKDVNLLLEKGYFFADPISLDFMLEKANKEGGYEIRLDRELKTFRFAKKEEKRQQGEVRYNARAVSQEDEERE